MLEIFKLQLLGQTTGQINRISLSVALIPCLAAAAAAIAMAAAVAGLKGDIP